MPGSRLITVVATDSIISGSYAKNLMPPSIGGGPQPPQLREARYSSFYTETFHICSFLSLGRD